eukprot:Nk52_evm2s218 gene=Nk52_evmTU2s218
MKLLKACLQLVVLTVGLNLLCFVSAIKYEFKIGEKVFDRSSTTTPTWLCTENHQNVDADSEAAQKAKKEFESNLLVSLNSYVDAKCTFHGKEFTFKLNTYSIAVNTPDIPINFEVPTPEGVKTCSSALLKEYLTPEMTVRQMYTLTFEDGTESFWSSDISTEALSGDIMSGYFLAFDWSLFPEWTTSTSTDSDYQEFSVQGRIVFDKMTSKYAVKGFHESPLESVDISLEKLTLTSQDGFISSESEFGTLLSIVDSPIVCGDPSATTDTQNSNIMTIREYKFLHEVFGEYSFHREIYIREGVGDRSKNSCVSQLGSRRHPNYAYTREELLQEFIGRWKDLEEGRPYYTYFYVDEENGSHQTSKDEIGYKGTVEDTYYLTPAGTEYALRKETFAPADDKSFVFKKVKFVTRRQVVYDRGSNVWLVKVQYADKTKQFVSKTPMKYMETELTKTIATEADLTEFSGCNQNVLPTTKDYNDPGVDSSPVKVTISKSFCESGLTQIQRSVEYKTPFWLGGVRYSKIDSRLAFKDGVQVSVTKITPEDESKDKIRLYYTPYPSLADPYPDAPPDPYADSVMPTTLEIIAGSTIQTKREYKHIYLKEEANSFELLTEQIEPTEGVSLRKTNSGDILKKITRREIILPEKEQAMITGDTTFFVQYDWESSSGSSFSTYIWQHLHREGSLKIAPGENTLLKRSHIFMKSGSAGHLSEWLVGGNSYQLKSESYNVDAHRIVNQVYGLQRIECFQYIKSDALENMITTTYINEQTYSRTQVTRKATADDYPMCPYAFQNSDAIERILVQEDNTSSSSDGFEVPIVIPVTVVPMERIITAGSIENVPDLAHPYKIEGQTIQLLISDMDITNGLKEALEKEMKFEVPAGYTPRQGVTIQKDIAIESSGNANVVYTAEVQNESTGTVIKLIAELVLQHPSVGSTNPISDSKYCDLHFVGTFSYQNIDSESGTRFAEVLVFSAKGNARHTVEVTRSGPLSEEMRTSEARSAPYRPSTATNIELVDFELTMDGGTTKKLIGGTTTNEREETVTQQSLEKSTGQMVGAIWKKVSEERLSASTSNFWILVTKDILSSAGTIDERIEVKCIYPFKDIPLWLEQDPINANMKPDNNACVITKATRKHALVQSPLVSITKDCRYTIASHPTTIELLKETRVQSVTDEGFINSKVTTVYLKPSALAADGPTTTTKEKIYIEPKLVFRGMRSPSGAVGSNRKSVKYFKTSVFYETVDGNTHHKSVQEEIFDHSDNRGIDKANDIVKVVKTNSFDFKGDDIVQTDTYFRNEKEGVEIRKMIKKTSPTERRLYEKGNNEVIRSITEIVEVGEENGISGVITSEVQYSLEGSQKFFLTEKTTDFSKTESSNMVGATIVHVEREYMERADFYVLMKTVTNRAGGQVSVTELTKKRIRFEESEIESNIYSGEHPECTENCKYRTRVKKLQCPDRRIRYLVDQIFDYTSAANSEEHGALRYKYINETITEYGIIERAEYKVTKAYNRESTQETKAKERVLEQLLYRTTKVEEDPSKYISLSLDASKRLMKYSLYWRSPDGDSYETHAILEEDRPADDTDYSIPRIEREGQDSGETEQSDDSLNGEKESPQLESKPLQTPSEENTDSRTDLEASATTQKENTVINSQVQKSQRNEYPSILFEEKLCQIMLRSSKADTTIVDLIDSSDKNKEGQIMLFGSIFKHMPNYEVYSFSDFALSTISNANFDPTSLSDITQLTISNAKVTQLFYTQSSNTINLINGMTSLSHLDLSGNPVSYIPHDFFDSIPTGGLKYLDLSGMDLTSLPRYIPLNQNHEMFIGNNPRLDCCGVLLFFETYQAKQAKRDTYPTVFYSPDSRDTHVTCLDPNQNSVNLKDITSETMGQLRELCESSPAPDPSTCSTTGGPCRGTKTCTKFNYESKSDDTKICACKPCSSGRNFLYGDNCGPCHTNNVCDVMEPSAIDKCISKHRVFINSGDSAGYYVRHPTHPETEELIIDLTAFAIESEMLKQTLLYITPILKKFSASFNELAQITPDFFRYASSLQTIDLKKLTGDALKVVLSTDLSEKENGFFHQLHELRSLKLVGKKDSIEKIELTPKSFSGLKSLKFLVLEDIEVSLNPTSKAIFAPLVNLEHLFIQKLSLSSSMDGFPFESLTSLKHLEILSLSGIDAVPDNFFAKNINLRVLILEDMPKMDYTIGIHRMQQINHVALRNVRDLGDNRFFEQIFGSSEQTPYLKSIDISNNGLTEIPPSLLGRRAKGSPIHVMDISGNDLKCCLIAPFLLEYVSENGDLNESTIELLLQKNPSATCEAPGASKERKTIKSLKKTDYETMCDRCSPQCPKDKFNCEIYNMYSAVPLVKCSPKQEKIKECEDVGKKAVIMDGKSQCVPVKDEEGNDILYSITETEKAKQMEENIQKFLARVNDDIEDTSDYTSIREMTDMSLLQATFSLQALEDNTYQPAIDTTKYKHYEETFTLSLEEEKKYVSQINENESKRVQLYNQMRDKDNQQQKDRVVYFTAVKDEDIQEDGDFSIVKDDDNKGEAISALVEELVRELLDEKEEENEEDQESGLDSDNATGQQTKDPVVNEDAVQDARDSKPFTDTKTEVTGPTLSMSFALGTSELLAKCHVKTEADRNTAEEICMELKAAFGKVYFRTLLTQKAYSNITSQATVDFAKGVVEVPAKKQCPQSCKLTFKYLPVGEALNYLRGIGANVIFPLPEDEDEEESGSRFRRADLENNFTESSSNVCDESNTAQAKRKGEACAEVEYQSAMVTEQFINQIAESFTGRAQLSNLVAQAQDGTEVNLVTAAEESGVQKAKEMAKEMKSGTTSKDPEAEESSTLSNNSLVLSASDASTSKPSVNVCAKSQCFESSYNHDEHIYAPFSFACFLDPGQADCLGSKGCRRCRIEGLPNHPLARETCDPCARSYAESMSNVRRKVTNYEEGHYNETKYNIPLEVCVPFLSIFCVCIIMGVIVKKAVQKREEQGIRLET